MNALSVAIDMLGPKRGRIGAPAVGRSARRCRTSLARSAFRGRWSKKTSTDAVFVTKLSTTSQTPTPPTATPTPPTETLTGEPTPPETPTPPQLPQPETELAINSTCEPNVAITTISNSGAYISGPLTIVLTDLRTQDQTKHINGSLAPGESIVIRTSWDEDYWLEVYERVGTDENDLPIEEQILEADIEGEACYIPSILSYH